MYRAPFPTPTSRIPTYIFPKAILDSREFLTEVHRGMGKLADKPALIVWGSGDPAFGEKERQLFEEHFPHHHTVILEGAGHFIQEDAAAQIVEALFGN